MASFTYPSKNVTTFENTNKTGLAQWSDTESTWDDPLYSWGATEISWTLATKNIIGGAGTTYEAGSPRGLLLTLTWDSEEVVGASSWTYQIKN